MSRQATDAAAFELNGDLDASKVAAIHRQATALCRSGRLPDSIDLGAVSQTDSSALALLLDWQEQARRHGRSIEFKNPPESLRVLASLSQVGELLGWQQERFAEAPQHHGDES